MPVRRAGRHVAAFAAALAAAGGLASVARADDDDEPIDDRFFVDKLEADGEEEATLWQGNLTSTSFLHREAAGISDPLGLGAVGAENASPARWFTDLRAQIDARHVRGGRWDARLDGRARVVSTFGSTRAVDPGDLGTQSGSGTGNEYDLRDLYVVRGGTRTDLFLGRQTVLDLAAVKIDGVRLDYAKDRRWTYLGFVGAYPVRGSRSIDTDYPQGVDAMGQPGGRVIPAAGGVGAAYRTQRTYGAFGAVAIVPLADDVATGTLEEPRLFATSNGYWRRSPQMDVYHYAVLDVLGSAGFSLTNLSAGVNYRPNLRTHVAAAYHRIDTETLNVQAQTTLEDPNPDVGIGVVRNNVSVTRIASDSARASLSAALGRTLRWEVSVATALRRRPEIVLEDDDPASTAGDQTIAAASSGELFLQVVDRRFYGGWRLAGSFIRVFDAPFLNTEDPDDDALGSGNAARTTASVARISGQRELKDGRAEVEVELSYAASKDEVRGTCTTADITDCYGSSLARTLALGGTGFYRIKRDWFVMGTVEIARQELSVVDGMATVDTPAILMTTAFVRASYRF